MTTASATHSESDETRARLRSAALLEPYEASLAHIRSLPGNAAIIAEPSDPQRLLEALIIGELRYLYDPTRERRTRSYFEVSSIRADTNHLELDASGIHLAAVLHNLLPAWMPGERSLDRGIPGLRHGANEQGDGVSFHLLEQQGRVTFTGISVTEFEQFRQRELTRSGLRSVTSQDPRRDPESRTRQWLIGDELLAGSVVIRRLGLLMHPDVSAIDSWSNRGENFNIELIASTDKPDPMPLILSQVLSPHLSPQLRLGRSDGYHHHLSIEDSKVIIDLRILRRAPSTRTRTEWEDVPPHEG